MTIQVFLSVGGENGILVKDYLKIPISPLWSISSKIPKTPLKIGTFQNQKIEVEKMVWFFQVEKMGSPKDELYDDQNVIASSWLFPILCHNPRPVENAQNKVPHIA